MKLPSLDQWQYRLSRTPAEQNTAVSIGDLWLEVGEGLPVTQLSDQTGAPVGVLLGFAIDLQARCIIDETWQVPAELGPDVDAFVQAGLLALGGRFLWVFHTQGITRVYPDCSAQVPCVFDPVAQLVGSTAHALMEDAEYEARFDAALFDEFGVDGEGWFPAELTAHKGLSRVLPHHYLELQNWTVQRSWFGPEGETDDPGAVVDEIITIVQAQIEALVKGPKRVAMTLTAGHETRMLLSCARDFTKQVDFVTITGGDRHKTDTVVASRIAAELGLSHLTLDRTTSTPEQRARFIRRGGHCNADSNSNFHPSVWPISESHVMVSGLGGEIARAFLWRDADTPQTTLTPELFSARLGLPKNDDLHQRLARWLSVLGGTNSLHVLDMAYHEHRDGAWYAVQFCSDPGLVRQAPLLTTRTVDLLMQLPAEWKRADRLGHEIISRQWPELEKFPYNSLGKWQDLWIKLQRVAGNPKLVLKKLRKMQG